MIWMDEIVCVFLLSPRFLRAGSEAMEAAMKLARQASKCAKVFVLEYQNR